MTTTTNIKGMLAMLTLGMLAAACENKDPASLIEKTRVLGARVEVQGAPDRATPRPGEEVTVTWLVTAPESTPPLGWAFVLCPDDGIASSAGCSDTALGLFQGHEPTPAVTFTVPAAEAMKGRALVLFGRVCSDSEPTVSDTGMLGCTHNADGTTASLLIPVLASDGEGNHNPSLAGQAASWDGQPWPIAAADDCASLPQVRAGSEGHMLRLETAARDRERYTVTLGEQRRELLQVSHFTTAGKLERNISVVEAADPSATPTIQVKWDAPGAPPAGGQIVHFTFVARDLRGGADWTTRAVCVVR